MARGFVWVVIIVAVVATVIGILVGAASTVLWLLDSFGGTP